MSEDEMTIYLDEKLYTEQSRGGIIKEINDILDQVEINQQYNICIDSIQNIFQIIQSDYQIISTRLI